jgi:hypothetical protein
MRRFAVSGMVWLVWLTAAPAAAQRAPVTYVGVLGGVSTLSADARSEVTSRGAEVSLYTPENGPAANILFGVHVHKYVSLQANYVWNANDVALTSVRGIDASFYEQRRTSSQHAVIGDVLVYFRNLDSVIRPYLSVGGGAVRIDTTSVGEARVRDAVPPAQTIRTVCAVVRTAVGIDVSLGRPWAVRYSFSETLTSNPFSAALSPPGRRKLANFQNLLGIVRTF